MNYTVAIYGAPYSSQSSQTALHFCRAAIEKGHQISRVFFYQDGVHVASTLAAPPQDESDIPAQWQKLIKEQAIDGVVCVAAALRRGILDHSEQKRHEKPAANFSDSMEISGLGQLIEGAANADRLITFGA